MEMPKRFRVSLRGAILAKFGTIKAAADATGIPRARLTEMLAGRGDLTGPQWRKLWLGLELWNELWEAMIRLVS